MSFLINSKVMTVLQPAVFLSTRAAAFRPQVHQSAYTFYSSPPMYYLLVPYFRKRADCVLVHSSPPPLSIGFLSLISHPPAILASTARISESLRDWRGEECIHEIEVGGGGSAESDQGEMNPMRSSVLILLSQSPTRISR